ncbi:uncharacterized protein At2g34160 [Mercurialis annua]|uniref:uncharacterized protein At2g34160 n=1 Tax=Mercurialis annua TaxID=3986 RepID=UPI00215FE009|nr:uncharacterized protein At2g34160 [Mercurialis annua]
MAVETVAPTPAPSPTPTHEEEQAQAQELAPEPNNNIAETIAADNDVIAAAAVVVVTAENNGHALQKKNRIQVSNTKKPLFFYVNLAKRYIQQHNEVELSALGMAITTVVTIAEILKNNGLATEKKVLTSTVGMKDENKGRLVQKAKIEIVLGKSEKFDSLMEAANPTTTTTTTTEAEPETKDKE